MKKIIIIFLVLGLLAGPAMTGPELRALDDFYGYGEIKYKPGSVEAMLCPDGPLFVAGSYIGPTGSDFANQATRA